MREKPSSGPPRIRGRPGASSRPADHPGVPRSPGKSKQRAQSATKSKHPTLGFPGAFPYACPAKHFNCTMPAENAHITACKHIEHTCRGGTKEPWCQWVHGACLFNTETKDLADAGTCAAKVKSVGKKNLKRAIDTLSPIWHSALAVLKVERMCMEKNELWTLEKLGPWLWRAKRDEEGRACPWKDSVFRGHQTIGAALNAYTAELAKPQPDYAAWSRSPWVYFFTDSKPGTRGIYSATCGVSSSLVNAIRSATSESVDDCEDPGAQEARRDTTESRRGRTRPCRDPELITSRTSTRDDTIKQHPRPSPPDPHHSTCSLQ